MLDKEKIAAILSLDSWDAVLGGLADAGLSYVRKGGGAVVRGGGEEIKASSVGRKFSLFYMAQRLGDLPEDWEPGQEPENEAPVSEPEPEPANKAPVSEPEPENKARVSSWGRLEELAETAASVRAGILRAIRDNDAESLESLCHNGKDWDAPYFAERFGWFKEKNRKALPDATLCEMWIRERKFGEVECEAFEMELYIEPDEDSILESFNEYQAALEAESFEVICANDKDRLGFHKRKGFPDGIPAENMPEMLGELLSINRKGEMIAFKPFSSRWHYIFVHYAPVNGLVELLSVGVEPAYIQEISPDIFQVIVKIPKTENEEADKLLENDMSRALNLIGGDCMPGSRRPHYAPGFTNWRGDEKDGLYPVAAVSNSKGKICAALAEYGEWALENRPAPVVGEFKPEEEPVKADGVAIYKAHRDDVLRAKGQKLEEADHSSIDLAVATRLRGTGHSQEEVEEILVSGGRETRPGAHKWEDYARRTARKAFSDDRILLKYQNWLSKWREIELRAACLPQRAGAMT